MIKGGVKMKNGKGHPLSLPERADNAVENIKCSFCGTMFGLGYDEGEEVVICPVCEREVTTGKAKSIFASNEDY